MQEPNVKYELIIDENESFGTSVCFGTVDSAQKWTPQKLFIDDKYTGKYGFYFETSLVR